MKKYLFLLFVLTSYNGFSQSVNDYKYAIVPSKFSFLKEQNQYRLNMLTKMLMEKYGFVTYFDTDVLPTEIANQNCNKVFVDVLKESNMFITKLTVVLKDCKNNILYTSTEGKSREKEYQVAYNQALREAFNSFDILGYKYNGENVIDIPQKQKTEAIVQVPVDENEDYVILLSAQPIINGYLLIGLEDKIYMKILKTSNKDYFIATKGTISGILFLKDHQWVFEYYQGEKLVSKKIEVKF
jgi:hypothetical protein